MKSFVSKFSVLFAVVCCFSMFFAVNVFADNVPMTNELYVSEVANDAAADLGLGTQIGVVFYANPSDGKFAYVSPSTPSTLYVNSSLMFNPVYFVGRSQQRMIAETVAAEMRHLYQAQHIYDQTDYGRNILLSYLTPVDRSNIIAYLSTYHEVDARDYGVKYADKRKIK